VKNANSKGAIGEGRIKKCDGRKKKDMVGQSMRIRGSTLVIWPPYNGGFPQHI